MFRLRHVYFVKPKANEEGRFGGDHMYIYIIYIIYIYMRVYVFVCVYVHIYLI